MKRLLAGIMVVLVLLAACAPAIQQSSPAVPSALPGGLQTPPSASPEPALPDNLSRNCPTTAPAEARNFNTAGLATGSKAINFTLRDIEDREYRLSRLLAEKPVVLVFGAFT